MWVARTLDLQVSTQVHKNTSTQVAPWVSKQVHKYTRTQVQKLHLGSPSKYILSGLSWVSRCGAGAFSIGTRMLFSGGIPFSWLPSIFKVPFSKLLMAFTQDSWGLGCFKKMGQCLVWVQQPQQPVSILDSPWWSRQNCHQSSSSSCSSALEACSGSEEEKHYMCVSFLFCRRYLFVIFMLSFCWDRLKLKLLHWHPTCTKNGNVCVSYKKPIKVS